MFSAVVPLTLLAAATAVAASPTPVADNRPVAGASLPSGSSDEFHRQMIEWDAVSRSPLVTRNRISQVPVERLDGLAISSRFGWRRDPITRIGRRHAGID